MCVILTLPPTILSTTLEIMLPLKSVFIINLDYQKTLLFFSNNFIRTLVKTTQDIEGGLVVLYCIVYRYEVNVV